MSNKVIILCLWSCQLKGLWHSDSVGLYPLQDAREVSPHKTSLLRLVPSVIYTPVSPAQTMTIADRTNHCSTRRFFVSSIPQNTVLSILSVINGKESGSHLQVYYSIMTNKSYFAVIYINVFIYVIVTKCWMKPNNPQSTCTNIT